MAPVFVGIAAAWQGQPAAVSASLRAARTAAGMDQYSLGGRNVVALRSASVMPQSVLTPKPLHGRAGSIG
jgi:hypothetical protein